VALFQSCHHFILLSPILIGYAYEELVSHAGKKEDVDLFKAALTWVDRGAGG